MVITLDIYRYIKYLYWWWLSSLYILYHSCDIKSVEWIVTPQSHDSSVCQLFALLVVLLLMPFVGTHTNLQEVIWCCCVPPRPIRPLDCNMQSWVFLQAADDVCYRAMSIGSWGCRGLPVIVIRDGTCLDWQVFLWPPSCWRCVVF